MAEIDTPAAASQQPPPTLATPLQQPPPPIPPPQPVRQLPIPPVPPSEFGGETNAESVDPSLQVEEQLLNRLLDRLQQMGITQAPVPHVELAQPARQEASVQQANGSPDTSSGWDQDWHQKPWSSWDDHWAASDWKSDDKGYKSWKDDDTWDRPYLSHLDFPKFDGRKEEYATYKYKVLNLKSQCGPEITNS